MSILKSTREIHTVSELSCLKVVVIMLSIDKVISPNIKVFKTTEVKLTFDGKKEYLCDNPIYLMPS